MRRGEIWTASGGQDHAGKPRPVVILQDDNFDATSSITICAFTTDETDAPLVEVEKPSISEEMNDSLPDDLAPPKLAKASKAAPGAGKK